MRVNHGVPATAGLAVVHDTKSSAPSSAEAQPAAAAVDVLDTAPSIRTPPTQVPGRGLPAGTEPSSSHLSVEDLMSKLGHNDALGGFEGLLPDGSSGPGGFGDVPGFGGGSGIPGAPDGFGGLGRGGGAPWDRGDWKGLGGSPHGGFSLKDVLDSALHGAQSGNVSIGISGSFNADGSIDKWQAGLTGGTAGKHGGVGYGSESGWGFAVGSAAEGDVSVQSSLSIDFTRDSDGASNDDDTPKPTLNRDTIDNAPKVDVLNWEEADTGRVASNDRNDDDDEGATQPGGDVVELSVPTNVDPNQVVRLMAASGVVSGGYEEGQGMGNRPHTAPDENGNDGTPAAKILPELTLTVGAGVDAGYDVGGDLGGKPHTVRG